EIYTLSLHDALPIYRVLHLGGVRDRARRAQAGARDGRRPGLCARARPGLGASPMNLASRGVARAWTAAALALFAARCAHGFLGVADTSFVTVIANPAEAANWAAELERLNDQLAAARGTLQTLGELRAFAGDPRA